MDFERQFLSQTKNNTKADHIYKLLAKRHKTGTQFSITKNQWEHCEDVDKRPDRIN